MKLSSLVTAFQDDPKRAALEKRCSAIGRRIGKLGVSAKRNASAELNRARSLLREVADDRLHTVTAVLDSLEAHFLSEDAS